MADGVEFEKPPALARIARRGFFRVFHPTALELEEAVDRAAEAARQLVFHDVAKMQRWIAAHVRRELCVDIFVEYDADEIGTGARELAVLTRHVGPAYVRLEADRVLT